ncbi:MAG TPA: CDP-diacylglycerol--glycerol-3-phosphate 3-phosphatidyltransferase [Thermopolyspora sp.]
MPETGTGPMMAPAARKVSTWNIANVLTVARLALVPFFTICMFFDGNGWRFAALTLFIIASVTDRLDGELARRYGLVTDFGKIADPIADKALIGAALVSLSVLGQLPWWITGVILGREVGVTLLRFAVIRHGIIPASWGGKVKTVLQIVAIVTYIYPGVPDWPRWIAMGVALLVTVVTGADYVIRAIRLRGVAKEVRTPMTDAGETPSSPSNTFFSQNISLDTQGASCGDLIALLVERGATVSVAESLTGGLIGAALSGPAGASAAFVGGVVAYATELKRRLLNVPANLLEREGAVHPEVAAAMARGVRALTGSVYGLAVTGVAGPDEQDGKAVGTVHIAVAGPGDDGDRVWHRDPRLRGSRAEIRAATATESLDLLWCVLHATTGEHIG